jgi:hypothetical protein
MLIGGSNVSLSSTSSGTSVSISSEFFLEEKVLLKRKSSNFNARPIDFEIYR